MNYIDMFILVLLIWAVFKGFTRGFIMQLTLLAALAVGVFAALKLSGFTARQLEGLINVNSESLFLVSVGITFILVFIGISILGRIVEKMVETIQLSIVNRLLGVLFSLVKMIFVAGIILAFVDRIDRKVHLLPENSQEHSFFYKPLTSISWAIFPSLKTPESEYSGPKEFVWKNGK